MDDQWILTEQGIQGFEAFRKKKKLSLRGFWTQRMGGRPASNWYNVIGKDGKSTTRQTIHEILTNIGLDAEDERYYQRVAPAPQSPETASLARLPEPTNLFVGKEREIAEIKDRLTQTRLFTLTGDAGSGKTRLALRVASDISEQFPDGMAMAPLAPLSDPRLVAQTVASALEIAEQTGKTYEQLLIEYFGDKRFLLLLDNCEHLLSACAQLTDALLTACPNIKILATSQEGFAIEEATYRVTLLSTPEPGGNEAPERLAEYESVRLLIERVRAAQPDFAVTSENASAIASLCSLLGGIPLALELVAPRVADLSEQAICAQLRERFDALRGRSRNSLSNPQILYAALDWSYDLLDPREQELLRRLSVFSGGWTQEAAEAASAGTLPAGEIPALLTALARHHLAEVREREGAKRYHFLESVRDYGRQQMEPSEAQAARQRHYDYFLTLAARAESGLESEEKSAWLHLLEADYANITAAMQWSLTEGAGPDGLRLPGCLPGFWQARGYFSEGLDWCRRALARSDPAARTQARAKILNAAGGLALCLAQYALAEIFHRECLAIVKELKLQAGIANTLNNLGLAAHTQGKYDLAIERYCECISIRRELGDKVNTAYALNNLAMVFHTQEKYDAAFGHYNEAQILFGDAESQEGIAYTRVNIGFLTLELKNYSAARISAARILFEKSLAFFSATGDQAGLAEVYHGLGLAALAMSDSETAWTHLQKSLIIREALPDPKGVAESLEAFAALAAAEQQTERSVKLWGAADAQRRRINTPLLLNKQAERQQSLMLARALTGLQFTAIWEEGAALSEKKAIAYALQNTPS